MISRLHLAVSWLVFVGAVPAAADDPKSFTCIFNSGSANSYAGGTFKPEKVGTITFEIQKINTEAQNAELSTPAGTRPLRVVRAINALHFLEVVGEGFLNITTIYDRDDVKGAFPAVHSRHFGILGQPVVGQYLGFCQANS
jgi:hypothetical protein